MNKKQPRISSCSMAQPQDASAFWQVTAKPVVWIQRQHVIEHLVLRSNLRTVIIPGCWEPWFKAFHGAFKSRSDVTLAATTANSIDGSGVCLTRPCFWWAWPVPDLVDLWPHHCKEDECHLHILLWGLRSLFLALSVTECWNNGMVVWSSQSSPTFWVYLHWQAILQRSVKYWIRLASHFIWKILPTTCFCEPEALHPCS